MSQSFNVEIRNIDQLRAALAKAPNVAAKYLSKAINAELADISKLAIDDNMQFKTPRALRTGMLVSTFGLPGKGMKIASESDLSGWVGPTVEYAKYVQFGTASHVIRAVKARILANAKTEQVFGPTVNHPGTKANPFMERIINLAIPNINAEFGRALDLIVSDLKA
jgi:hypothetical protein